MISFQVWFQNRRMKDKRQRMAMIWPYTVYADPAMMSLIAAASASLPPSPYHHPGQGMPTSHMSVPPGYQNAAAAAAYYATRYSPYGAPPQPTAAQVPVSTSSGLHRSHHHHPHHQQSPVNYHPHHLLQPHHQLPPLHLPGLGMTSPMNNGYGPTTPTNQANLPTTPTYRSAAHLPEFSPVNSDASSDCDCAGSIHLHHAHQLQNNILDKTLSSSSSLTPPLPPQSTQTISMPSLKLPPGLNLAGLQSIQSIQSAFESKNGGYYHGLITSATSPTTPTATKIEAPKLFQPYKNDITEKA